MCCGSLRAAIYGSEEIRFEHPSRLGALHETLPRPGLALPARDRLILRTEPGRGGSASSYPTGAGQRAGSLPTARCPRGARGIGRLGLGSRSQRAARFRRQPTLMRIGVSKTLMTLLRTVLILLPGLAGCLAVPRSSMLVERRGGHLGIVGPDALALPVIERYRYGVVLGSVVTAEGERG